MSQWLTTEEWLATLGEHIRANRLEFEGGMSRQDLASLAGVSVSALANLETAQGASLTTFVRVLRALRMEAWIDALKPSPVINPMLLLSSGKTRVRAPRKSKQGT